MKTSEKLLKKKHPYGRKQTIEEIAIRNELPVWKVGEIYLRFNYKLYLRKAKKDKRMVTYNKGIEEQTFRLTERYFDIQKVKELVRNG